MTSPSSSINPSAPVNTGADEKKSIALEPFDASVGSDFFNWSIDFLEKRGLEMYGPKFRIDPADHPVIHKLLIYFLELKEAAENVGLDLNKGIFLTGPVGAGKTALLTLMRYVAAPHRKFAIKSCRDITFEYSSKGHEVILRYSTMCFNEKGAKTFCFDDLGAETTLNHFGNDCCVMGELLLSRYDQFINNKMITHITTNYTPSDLEKLYGNRVRSRLREMFNRISFNKSTPDKRIVKP